MLTKHWCIMIVAMSMLACAITAHGLQDGDGTGNVDNQASCSDKAS